MKHTVTHAVRDNVGRLALLMLLAVLPLLGWAQQMVRGVVTDKAGEPLIGVSVLVKGTPTGVTTDIDGSYAIAARTGQTLVFSYVGMNTQEVRVGQSSTLDIVMQDNAMNLDDVVVGHAPLPEVFAEQPEDEEALAASPDPGHDLDLAVSHPVHEPLKVSVAFYVHITSRKSMR